MIFLIFNADICFFHVQKHILVFPFLQGGIENYL